MTGEGRGKRRTPLTHDVSLFQGELRIQIRATRHHNQWINATSLTTSRSCWAASNKKGHVQNAVGHLPDQDFGIMRLRLQHDLGTLPVESVQPTLRKTIA